MTKIETREQLIEMMAQTLCRIANIDPFIDAGNSSAIWLEYKPKADLMLDILELSAGLRIVSVEPTDYMIRRGAEDNPTLWNESTDDGFSEDVSLAVYSAMLAASPFSKEGAK